MAYMDICSLVYPAGNLLCRKTNPGMIGLVLQYCTSKIKMMEKDQ